MAGEHWRDLHRHPSGKFLPRPGKKGFRDPKTAPPTDTDESKAPSGRGMALLIRDRNPGSGR